MGAPEKLYLSEDFGEAARAFAEKRKPGQVQGTLTMRRSTDRILTSHAGSLPRPDDLIEANQPARSGQGRRGGFPEEARAVGGRRRAPPGRRRHRRPGRRRVRQVDGLQGQLPRLVELFLHAAGRPKIEDIDRDTLPVHRSTPGQYGAVDLRRPPRPRALRRRLFRSRVRASRPGPRPSNWPFASGRSATPATPRSPPTSPTSRRRSRPTASARAS